MNIIHILLLVFICSCKSEFKEDKYSINNDLKNYQKSVSCKECHQKQYSEWLESDHYHSMQEPTTQTVKAPFRGEKFKFQNEIFLFYQKDNKFFVSYNNKEFQIIYTFGHNPLQQYIIDVGQGAYQVLTASYNIKNKAWFEVNKRFSGEQYKNYATNSYLNNWNSRCSSCHSTAIKKNFKFETNTYKTQFKEVNVSCFSCHGPSAKHIEWAQGEKAITNKGFESLIVKQPQFIDPKKNHKGHYLGENKMMNRCFKCHSLRTDLGDSQLSTHNFLDNYSPRVINDQTYHWDGQIKEEAFVMGSFTQSKMFHAGVSCTNCHSPHSGKLKYKDDNLCLQCHNSSYSKPEHNNNESKSCTECHMPKTHYMEIDARADHKIVIPSRNRKKKYIDDFISQVNKGNYQSYNEIVDKITNENVPEMTRAFLISKLSYFPNISIETIKKLTQTKSSLIKIAVIELIGTQRLDQSRIKVLLSLASEKSKAISSPATYLLAINRYKFEKLKNKLDEYLENLKAHSDLPENILKWAVLASFGYTDESPQELLQKSIDRYPSFIPAYINLAHYYKSIGNFSKEYEVLSKAERRNSRNSSLQLTWGLYYIRQKNYKKGLSFLKTALKISPDNNYLQYVYLSALTKVKGKGAAKAHIKSINTALVNSVNLNQMALGLFNRDSKEYEYYYKNYLRLLEK